MKKIDLYIIKSYLKTFFFTALIFSIIAIAFDVAEKIGKIIDQGLSAKELILNRYVDYIPYINGELWPLFALIAVIFVASRMARNTEVIAILASGTSFFRYLRPFLLCGIVLGIAFGLGKHLVIPKGNKSFKAYEVKHFWPNDEKVLYNDIHLFLNPDSKIYIRSFRKRDTTLLNCRIESFEEGRLSGVWKVKKILWQGPPNQWRFEGIEKRILARNEEKLEYREEALDTFLNLQPNDFVRYVGEREKMTTPELKEHIAYEKAKGLGHTKRFEIETLKRSSEPFTMIILIIIGASIASRKKRGGMGLNLALGVGIGALYIILSKFSQTFSINSDLPPAVGVWIPNVLFTAVAILLYLRAQK